MVVELIRHETVNRKGLNITASQHVYKRNTMKLLTLFCIFDFSIDLSKTAEVQFVVAQTEEIDNSLFLWNTIALM